MASTMLAPSSVGGLATCSKFCTQNEWNCYEKRKMQASKSLVFLSSFHWVHRNQFGWHVDVCMEKSRALSLRAVYDDDQSVEDDDDKGDDEVYICNIFSWCTLTLIWITLVIKLGVHIVNIIVVVYAGLTIH